MVYFIYEISLLYIITTCLKRCNIDMVENRTTKDEWDKFLFLVILCFLMRRNCIRDKLPLYEL